MTHRSIAVLKPRKPMVLALFASVVMIVGSPFVSSSSASNRGGADKAVSANHGDCKHANSGVHNGYDCPEHISITLF
ncbi:MAG TPA: hypothetical protein VGY97_01475 [Solirubrobacteraceae bacterium]|nr:hypothetical protein [Solirubrobacteraceae bacterium]